MLATTKKHCIHEGKNSRIYLATEDGSERRVIVKQLRQLYPNPETMARYAREFEITRKAQGPHIITAHHHQVEEGVVSLVLEDFEASSLAKILEDREHRLDLKEALRVAIQVAQGLSHLHRLRIVHKDINPSNIVWNTETGLVKLIDFGISQVLDSTRVRAKPLLNFSGTPAYVSPEQTGRMNRSVDARSDLYSLGVTLYELVTGRLPFESDDPLELVHAHIARTPSPPIEVDSAIPAQLSELITTLLQKRAEDRYASAEGVKHDLEACLESLEGGPGTFLLRQRDQESKLRIPQKLYGREEETQKLLDAFDRVAGGSVGVVLVAGYSGVGKTSLVHQVHIPLTAQRGIYVEGKFDQLNRGTPYGSLAQAFRSLMRQLVTESEETLERWRRHLSQAVGSNGQVLVDVIPELALVLGPQPPVQELAPAESRNRFQHTLSCLLQAIGTAEHPLVLFLDDLQWADLPTIELIGQLATDPECQYVLFIGAYRDNEISPPHPLLSVMADLEQRGADIETIKLEPLGEEDVLELVGDTLSKPPGFLRLALACHAKTRGNAFFLTRFLEGLQERGLLSYDLDSQRWNWDLDAIKAESITDNVVEFMSSAISQLNPPTREALLVASCIGNTFDLATLADALEIDRAALSSRLRDALEAGLIVSTDEGFWFEAHSHDHPVNFGYVFVHDRVQQAAYSLLEPGRASAVHLTLGRLLEKTGDKDQLFELVSHLNLGSALIEDPEEQLRLCKLNLEAGRRALNSAAFRPAHEFYRKAHQALPSSPWEQDYQLALEVHLEGARAAYLSGEYESMEELLSATALHARDRLHKVRGEEIRIQALIGQEKLRKAVEAALDVIELLGYPLDREPGAQLVQAEVGATLELLQSTATEKLASLPEAKDQEVIVALRVQNSVLAAAYLAVPNLLPLFCCQMVRMTLHHGVTAPAIYAYSVLGLICVSVGMPRVGYDIGKIAMGMLERWDDPAVRVKNLHVVGGVINGYLEPLRRAVENHRQVYRLGLDCGDLEYAAWGLHNEVANSFWSGFELAELAQTLDHHMAALRHHKQRPALACTKPLRQVVANLRGLSEDPSRLVGPDYDEERHITALDKRNTRGAVFCVAVAGMVVRFTFGDYDAVLDKANRWADYADGVQGTYQVVAWHQYRALAILRRESSDSANMEALRADLAPHLEFFSKLAEAAPHNFLHRQLLLKAELARLEGHRGQAQELYEKAATQANAGGFIQDEALANELAGRHLLELGSIPPARGYLLQAIFLYSYWGALAKSDQLEAEFSELLPGFQEFVSSRRSSTRTTRETDSSNLDLAVVVRASHAISKQIVLGDLIQSLVRLALEAAGAQRGLLLLEQEGQWSVKCEGVVEDGLILRLLDAPLESYSECPDRLIEYVRRTREEVILRHASERGLFCSDAYIQRRKTRSVLCLPVKQQNEMKAILYLENDLAPGIFSRQHLDLLRLLVAQAAISIENAQLYNTLERRVEERTRELQLEIKERTRVQEELRVLATTDSLTGASNRRHFLELAEREFERTRRYPAPLSALMLDADHFKQVNDTWGHDVGDKVLKSLCRVIQSELRATELLGRMGGEEFAIALPSTPCEGAMVVAERLRLAVSQLTVPVGEAEVSFTVSIGVAQAGPEDNSFAAVLSRADRALYQAKEQGRNRVVSAEVSALS